MTRCYPFVLVLLFSFAAAADDARPLLAGKPVVGIRTANHAFCLRNKQTPQGRALWVNWERDAFGGKLFYTSLVHEQDFAGDVFPTRLTNAIRWALHQD